jgi:hypothetical protein
MPDIRNRDLDRAGAPLPGPKKRYAPPDILEYGRVSELTTQVGSDDGQPPGQGGGGF